MQCFSVRFRSLANAAAYSLRRRVRWSRGIAPLPHESKELLFRHLDGAERSAAHERERELRQRYDLQSLFERSTCEVYRENLYLLDLFEGHLCEFLPRDEASLRAIDVGSRNWSYVFALERFLREDDADTPRAIELTGIEVDGHGIYPDFYARADRARAQARLTGNPRVQYQVADFVDYESVPCDVVFLLFPFLTQHALLRWGLPVSLLDPAGVLDTALSLLNPGGVIVSLQQTTAERRVLERIVAERGAEISSAISANSRLLGDPLAEDRQLSLIWAADAGRTP